MGFAHRTRQALSASSALPLYVSRGEFLRLYLSSTLRRLRAKVGGYDPLTRLAAKYRTDKGLTVFPFHGYTKEYARLFQEVRHEPLTLLEIGLAKEEDRDSLDRQGITCPSLCLWLDYFPRATIYGLDLDDFTAVRLPRTRIFRGDQSDVELLRAITRACPAFDIIIDDGSHMAVHQQVSLRALWPALSPGGLYVIEDVPAHPRNIASERVSAVTTAESLSDRAALQDIAPGAATVTFLCSRMDESRSGMLVLKKSAPPVDLVRTGDRTN
jgi:hypothetical protein